jgi:hypothetical protein
VALAGNPLVACELLTHLAGDGQDLESALAWLQPVVGGVLAPFSTVMGRAPGEVSEQAIGQLADHDAEYVSALLVAAHSLNRLELVLPGFASWLGDKVLRRGAPDPAQGQYWYDRVIAIQRTTAPSAAWLDLVLLILGKPLRFLLARVDQRTRKLYTDSIVNGWVALSGSLGRPGDDLLTHNLTVYLRQERWAADAATATGVTDLARPLTRDGQRPGLRAAISDALERSPEAARWQFAREWLPPVRKQQRSSARDDQKSRQQEEPQPGPQDVRRSPADAPPLAQSSHPQSAEGPALIALRALGQDATAAQVAGLLTDAYRDNLDLQDVRRALGDSKVIRSGAEAMDVLDKLRPALLAAPGKRSAAEDWLGHFAHWFADGSFGAQAADEFSRFAIQSSVDEINYYSRILRIVTVRNQEHAKLGARDTEILIKVRKLLDQILPDSKKLPNLIQNVLRQGKQGGDGGNEPR